MTFAERQALLRVETAARNLNETLAYARAEYDRLGVTVADAEARVRDTLRELENILLGGA